MTHEKANGQYRLLINDGHDSHITGDWLAHCQENKIIPVILSPHSSHLTQPLDIGIFRPLKKVMAQEIMPILMMQVRRLHKAEWLAAFIKAHEAVFNLQNIQSAFTGAGLVPFQPLKVLRRVAPAPIEPPSLSHSTRSVTPEPFNDAVLTSSLIDMSERLKANAALHHILDARGPITSLTRNYIQCLTRANEHLYARNAILMEQIDIATKVLSGRKEQTSRKRKSIKGKHIITGEELRSIREAEEVTKQKKRRRLNEVPNMNVDGSTLLSNNVTMGINH